MRFDVNTSIIRNVPLAKSWRPCVALAFPLGFLKAIFHDELVDESKVIGENNNAAGLTFSFRTYRPKIRLSGLDNGNRRLRQTGKIGKFSLRQFGELTDCPHHLTGCQVNKRFGWSNV
jgi:hypothetical protein